MYTAGSSALTVVEKLAELPDWAWALFFFVLAMLYMLQLVIGQGDQAVPLCPLDIGLVLEVLDFADLAEDFALILLGRVPGLLDQAEILAGDVHRCKVPVIPPTLLVQGVLPRLLKFDVYRM